MALMSMQRCDINLSDKKGNTPLHVACKLGHCSTVQFLIADQRCQFKARNRDGESPLHTASEHGHLDTVKVLVSSKECDLNIQDERGNTPLHTACKHGHHSTVEFLVADQRCQFKARNRDGESPLHTASEHGNLDTVKVLVSRTECDINIQDERGNTPLHLACHMKAQNIVKSLLQEACSTNILNKKGETAERIPLNEDGDCLLHIACQWGDVDIVRYLVINQRCNPYVINTSKHTPLHTASERGNLDVVKVLVSRKKCDLNAPDERGNTPLHTACKHGHHSTVECLVADQRCQVNARNRDGESPLHSASEHGHVGTVKVLIRRKECDLNIQDERGNTPLHLACHIKARNIVKSLLQKACSTNILNKKGETAERIPLNEGGDCLLHIACQWGDVDIVRYLIINQRCNPYVINTSKQTPVHTASERGNLDVVKVLVSKRECDLNTPDERGNTPLHTACKHGHHSTVEFLVADQRCQLNARNRDSESPLHTASEHGHLDTVKVLVSRRECDLNIQDERGNTPLHTACKHGHHSTVEFLVADQRCQFKARNRDGESPLHTASEHGHLDTVNVLISRTECDLNIQDERGNTPLHLACHMKARNIAKSILQKACSTDIPNKKGETAERIPLNKDRDYLLHVACQWGDLDIIRYLVTEQKCDPNILNKHHLTPLLATIKHGKPSVAAALLQHAKCDLSLHDQAGNTALHLACIRGQTEPEMVKVAKNLIISADPLSVNNAGQTPIELTTNYELIQAISHFTECKTKHSVQTYINLFIVGNPETGKSTLIKAVCKEASVLWKFLPKELRRVKNVPPHTAGIIPTTFQSKTFGNTVLYDLAGQTEYYTSHAAVIQTTVISTPPAFIIVVNMSETEEKISETLRYWWSFINNHAARASALPQVILVGSHADKVKARGGSAQEKMSQVSALLKRLPTSFYFAGQVVLDCRDPASRKLQLFCSLVNKSCCELRWTADVDLRCHVLYAFLLEKFPGKVACTVSDITTTIQESDALLPQNPDGLIPLISTLSDKGLLLLVADSVGNEDSWVILQKQALLGEINGTIFAPKEFSQHKKDLSTSTGVVPLLQLKLEFPDYIPEMIAKFLTHLEFCFKVDDQEILELLKDEDVHVKNMPQNLSEEYYFFPALVSVENPLQVWEQDDVMICQCGWLYRCSRHDQFLTTQFLHVLILRLAFSFALHLHTGDFHEDSLVLRRRCSVWKRGIGWLKRIRIETVVEVGLLNQSVIVMMRCPRDKEAECAQLRSEIIQKVIGTKDELCKAVRMSESFIHPMDIKYPFIDNTEDLKYYSLTEIGSATVEGADNVLDNRGRNPFPVKDLLLFDPQATANRELLRELFSEKHSLDWLVHGHVLEKLQEGEAVLYINCKCHSHALSIPYTVKPPIVDPPR